MKKTCEAAAELGKFHDVTRFVTLTCQKSVLWVRGTASNQLLCSLLHKNSDIFMESVNTDQKDKLLTFLIMHHTCQNSKHKYLFPNMQKFLTSIFFHLHSLNTRNRSPLPNDMRTRVNWLAVTSYDRVKGHIMWINVSLDNDYLLIIENIWKNCN